MWRRAVTDIAIRQTEQAFTVKYIELGRSLPSVSEEPVDLWNSAAMVLVAHPLDLDRCQPIAACGHTCLFAVTAEVYEDIQIVFASGQAEAGICNALDLRPLRRCG